MHGIYFSFLEIADCILYPERWGHTYSSKPGSVSALRAEASEHQDMVFQSAFSNVPLVPSWVCSIAAVKKSEL